MWRPALAPNEYETAEAFYEQVRASLHDTEVTEGIDIEKGTRVVLEFLTDHVDEGQILHVTGQLPAEVRALWPEKVVS